MNPVYQSVMNVATDVAYHVAEIGNGLNPYTPQFQGGVGSGSLIEVCAKAAVITFLVIGLGGSVLAYWRQHQ